MLYFVFLHHDDVYMRVSLAIVDFSEKKKIISRSRYISAFMILNIAISPITYVSSLIN